VIGMQQNVLTFCWYFTGVNGHQNQPGVYYQKHHELSRQQQELLQRQIKQKMQFEEVHGTNLLNTLRLIDG
jgi:hypothetical protein